ncbi:MAG: protein kinase, partial [bacterium]|nr:protein kinase [bacterium]
MPQPTRIGKYELRRSLGGGMAQVFEAWDTVIGRTVAVKILKEESAADPDAKARFLREAQLAGGLSHDNVMRVYDFGEEQGRPYMVMEFLQGQDLRDAIKGGATGDLDNRLRIAIETAKALDYINAEGIVHRDIKPENIHLDTTGRVRLMDFGIAKRQELNLTRTGLILGTPYYMAPEQVKGQEVTQLADIYSFGILVFELLTGKRPTTGETIEQVFYAILNEPLDMEPLWQSGASEPIRALVASCTAKASEDRPQSFAEVCRRLEGTTQTPDPRAVTTEALAAPPVPVEPPKPGKKWLLPAVAVVLLLAATLTYLAFNPPPEPEPEPDPGPPSLSAVLDTPTGRMVLAPEGEFLFGPDNQPARLDPFYVDQTEVTNAAYAEFCAELNRPLPVDFPSGRPDYPVVNVTIDEAREFANWAGKRLPTPREWEKAARGADGRPYPWGVARDPTRANVADAGSSGSALLPAVSLPLGASPFDALQMAGNVWEF